MKKKRVYSPADPNPAMIEKVAHKLPIPEICNLCGGKVSLRHFPLWGDGRYPWAYECENCHSRASLHRDTDLPMGTLANRQTRRSRTKCKESFFAVIEAGIMTKRNAYSLLATIMGLDPARCHFSMFNSAQCAHAKAVCDKWLKDAGIIRPKTPVLWGFDPASPKGDLSKELTGDWKNEE